MNITKKLMVTAGVILQLTTSLCASYNAANWANAFLAFAGGSDPVAAAAYILSPAFENSASAAAALSAVQPHGVKVNDEANAVGAMASKNNKNLFPSVYSEDDVLAAARQLIAQAAPVKKQAPAPAPAMPLPSTQKSPASNSGWSLFGGSSAAPDASVQKAVAQAQKADVLAATQNDSALAHIANGGAQGADLYKLYVDQIFDLLEQALNTIPSKADQNEVLAYIQAQIKGLQVIPAANSQSSRTLGRMSSKKADKAAKKSWRK